jgi:flagellar biosynthesis protein FlhF
MSTLEHVQARQTAKEEQAREMQIQAKPVKAINELAQHSVQDDVEQLSMSTLTFQDYVRERMLRRRHESSLDSSEACPLLPSACRAQQRAPRHGRQVSGSQRRWSATILCAPRRFSSESARPVSTAAPQNFMQELQSMKDLIEERFNTLTWLGQTRQNPIQSSLMHKLIRAGYSPALACADREAAGDALRRRRRALADAGAGAQSAHRCRPAHLRARRGVCPGRRDRCGQDHHHGQAGGAVRGAVPPPWA